MQMDWLKMKILSLSLSPPRVYNILHAVPYAMGRAAASSKDTSSGSAMALSALIVMYSASPPLAFSPRAPSCPSESRIAGSIKTRSPGDKSLTPVPISSISPASFFVIL